MVGDVEFAFLHDNHAVYLRRLQHFVERDGITEPIVLGNDGRVWDGHHRLCVATDLNLTSVPVTFIC